MPFDRFPYQFGKYILLDRLNSGGMAEVFRAKLTGEASFQRLLAIKCMLPDLARDQQFVTMFVDEAKLAAQLSHPHVVQIHELGRIHEQLYIAMELVNGRDLRNIIRKAARKHVPVPAGFAAYVLSRAAEGLDFAHQRCTPDGKALNLVHRDVSPQNILVSYDGEVKVVDFGIAKAELRGTQTHVGVLKGKFSYMAPEQVEEQEIDHRADIYALGAVLYETLSGKKLITGDSGFSILEKVRNANVRSMAELAPKIPSEVESILYRALARDPNQRYERASDFAEDLSPLLIFDKSIFGEKKAKEFMRALYADDIEAESAQMLRDVAVSERDCVNFDEMRGQPRESEIFGEELEKTVADALERERTVDLSGESSREGLERARTVDLSGESSRESLERARTVDLSGESSREGLERERTVDLSGESSRDSLERLHTGDLWRNSESQLDDWAVSTSENGWGAPTTEETMPTTHLIKDDEVQEDFTSSPAANVHRMDASRDEGGPGSIIRVVGLALGVALLVPMAVLLWVFGEASETITSFVEKLEIEEVTPGGPEQPESRSSDAEDAERAALNDTTDPREVEPGGAKEEHAPEQVTPVGAAQPPNDPTEETSREQRSHDEEKGVGRRVRTGHDSSGASAEREARRRAARRPRYGFVSIKVDGVRAARVKIDGRDVGFSPVVLQRLRAGRHQIELEEQREDGKAGRSKRLDVVVTPAHQRKEPLRLLVTM